MPSQASAWTVRYLAAYPLDGRIRWSLSWIPDLVFYLIKSIPTLHVRRTGAVTVNAAALCRAVASIDDCCDCDMLSGMLSCAMLQAPSFSRVANSPRRQPTRIRGGRNHGARATIARGRCRSSFAERWKQEDNIREKDSDPQAEPQEAAAVLAKPWTTFNN
jgi:hypothetical protein